MEWLTAKSKGESAVVTSNILSPLDRKKTQVTRVNQLGRAIEMRRDEANRLSRQIGQLQRRVVMYSAGSSLSLLLLGGFKCYADRAREGFWAPFFESALLIFGVGGLIYVGRHLFPEKQRHQQRLAHNQEEIQNDLRDLDRIRVETEEPSNGVESGGEVMNDKPTDADGLNRNDEGHS